MGVPSDVVTVTLPRSVVPELPVFANALDDRMHDLLERNTEGALSESERAELESLVQMAMASVGSRPVALDPDIVERFAARAKRLGTTPDDEVSRALREWLAIHEPAVLEESRSAVDTATGAAARRLVEEHGFLVLEGAVPADAIPDHRDLREERTDDLVPRSSGARGG